MSSNPELTNLEVSAGSAFTPESPSTTALPQSEQNPLSSAEAVRFLREGIAAAKAGNREAARSLLLNSSRLDSTNERVWLWLASISEQPTELYEFLQKVLAINPENARALEWSRATRTMLVNSAIKQGAAFAKEQNHAAAAECFHQATDYDPKNEVAWLWLASVTDELEDKLAYLKRILYLNPGNEKAAASFHVAKRQMARSLLKKGNTAAVSGDRSTALQILHDVMEFDPELEEAWLLQAFLSDSVEDKAESFRKVLEINPENVQAASGLASLQVMLKPEAEEFDEFIEDEFLETEACPFCSEMNVVNAQRCSMCKAFLTMEDAEDILVQDSLDDGLLREFIERHHAEQISRELSSEEHLNLGFAYVNLKNFKKGAAHFERAVEVAPENQQLKEKVAEWLQKLSLLAPELFNNETESGKMIMVVDDSPTVRKLIAGKLEKHGHRVVAAVDGMDALSKLNNEEKPDLVLLDVTMPRLDGYQLCKLIKNNAATKHIPVVMISGKDGFFDKVRGRMAGSTAYITKPFEPETLLQTVETYCK